jgi:hypothetical protein
MPGAVWDLARQFMEVLGGEPHACAPTRPCQSVPENDKGPVAYATGPPVLRL